jgi:feruloyl esterase
MNRCSFLAIAVLIAVFPDARAIAASCDSLATPQLLNTTVTGAETIAAGAFTPPPGTAAAAPQTYAVLQAFCRVTATLKPSSDSDIKIEVWLPASGWNGKFQAVGNGGWAGRVPYPALAAAVWTTVGAAQGRTHSTRWAQLSSGLQAAKRQVRSMHLT